MLRPRNIVIVPFEQYVTDDFDLVAGKVDTMYRFQPAGIFDEGIWAFSALDDAMTDYKYYRVLSLLCLLDKCQVSAYICDLKNVSSVHQELAT